MDYTTRIIIHIFCKNSTNKKFNTIIYLNFVPASLYC